MPSKLLINLIDRAILPAVLLCTSKIIAVLSFSMLWHYSFILDFAGRDILPQIVFSDPAQAIKINSYSDLVMYGAIFIGLFWIILRATKFHDTHVTPGTTATLAQRNLLKILSSSFTLYQEAAIWFLFIWLAAAITLVFTVMRLSYWWIPLITISASLVMSYLLLEDIEGELNVRRFIKHENN